MDTNINLKSKELSESSGLGKKKKNMLKKTWEKCRSMSMILRSHKYQPNEEEPEFTIISSPPPPPTSITKSKSWPHFSSSSSSSSKPGQKVAPEGCFNVYVGPEKQRFVVKAKYANHPLFQMLLEDSEMEYGYSSQGPILLPCEVHLLYKVLAEIDNQLTNPVDHDGHGYAPTGAAGSSCSPFMNPSRRRGRIRDHHIGSNYGLLSSPMLKLNNN